MDFEWFEIRRREVKARGGVSESPPNLGELVAELLEEERGGFDFHHGDVVLKNGRLVRDKDQKPKLVRNRGQLAEDEEVLLPYYFRTGEVLLGPGVADDARQFLTETFPDAAIRPLPGGTAVMTVEPGQEQSLAERIDREVRRIRLESNAGRAASADETADEAPEPQLTDVNRLFFAAPIDSTGPAGDPELPGTEVPPIGAPGAGAGILVAVVDTGMMPDFATHTALSYDVLLDPAHDFDGGYRGGYIRFPGGHGTFVAGIVRRVAPAATIRAVGVLNESGVVAESDLAVGLDRALDFHPHLINMSIDCPRPNPTGPVALQPILDRAHAAGVVIVAAAGNAGTTDPTWPGMLPEIVAVGAVEEDGGIAHEYSNHGPWVDVFARGDKVVNALGTGPYRPQRPGRTLNFTGLARWSGTSFATPIITGLIAARMASDRSTARTARDAVLADCDRVGALGQAPDGGPARLATLDTTCDTSSAPPPSP